MRRCSHNASAFSLVEVVLAIGVVAFAFVALIGLLPAGMTQFRKAIDQTVAAEIAQKLIDDAQSSDWDVLQATTWPSYRYFDERGVEIFPQSASAAQSSQSLLPSEQAKIVYQVYTRVVPNSAIPRADLQVSKWISTVTVQVMNNPAFYTPQFDPNPNQQPPCVIPNPHYSLLTFSAQVAASTFSNNTNYNP